MLFIETLKDTKARLCLQELCFQALIKKKKKWGDTQHPLPWKEQLCEKNSFSEPPTNSASQWQGGVGGGEGECEGTDTFLSCTLPHLTRYFSRKHINLRPIFFRWDYIDTDTNVWVMRRCCAETGASRLRGPDRSGQSDLLQVIFGTSVKWQLKNEPLKTLGGSRSGFLCNKEEVLSGQTWNGSPQARTYILREGWKLVKSCFVQERALRMTIFRH